MLNKTRFEFRDGDVCLTWLDPYLLEWKVVYKLTFQFLKFPTISMYQAMGDDAFDLFSEKMLETPAFIRRRLFIPENQSGLYVRILM
jgi:hypothetical protein